MKLPITLKAIILGMAVYIGIMLPLFTLMASLPEPDGMLGSIGYVFLGIAVSYLGWQAMKVTVRQYLWEVEQQEDSTT
jgi:uncharacterized membrane protein